MFESKTREFNIHFSPQNKAMNQKHKEIIKQYLLQGNLGKAIQELLEGTKQSQQDDLHTNLILLSSRFNSNKKDNNRGILSNEQYNRSKNQMTYALTSYLNEYTPSIETSSPPTHSGSSGGHIQQTHYGNGDNVGGNKIVHHTSSHSPKPDGPTKDKILFISANPTDAGRLQTGKEHRIIKAAMERGSQRDKYVFLPPQLSVTVQELVRAINDQPQIVHFSGHGEEEGIIITTDNNTAQVMPTRALKRLFKRLKGQTKVVLLNSCYSADQAKEISKYGMYVVGYNLPVGDLAAIGFAQGLYIGLGEGKSFEGAFDDAMIVLETQAAKYADRVEVWKDGERLNL